MNARLPAGFPILPVVTIAGSVLAVSALGGLYDLSLDNTFALRSRELAQLRERVGQEERQLQFVNTQIAKATAPEVIKERVLQQKLPMGPARQDQNHSLTRLPTLKQPRAGGLP